MANVQRPNIDAGRLLIFYVTSLSWLGVGRPGQHKTSAVSLTVTSLILEPTPWTPFSLVSTRI